MGSVPANDVILKDVSNVGVADSVVPKIEPGQYSYDSPSGSSLEEDHELDGDGETVQGKTSSDPPPPPPKRKGGRKPVSVTSSLKSRC